MEDAPEQQRTDKQGKTDVRTPHNNPRHDLLKPLFVKRYQELLGKRYEDYLACSFSYSPKSIRVNTLKMDVETLKARLSSRWHLTPVPWCPEGFWIRYKGDAEQEERFDIGNLPEHMLGFCYVQDAASMIPPQALRPLPGEVVLDLCAAPGSKTSQMVALMENDGLLVANELQSSRIPALAINLQRVGAKNAIITRMPGQRFAKKGILFDRILVDAPCSGTGTVSKNVATLEMWSPHLVSRLAKEQKTLIEAAYAALKPGGTMVYSTCTLEPEENEGVVDALLNKHPDAMTLDIDLPLKRTPAITSWDGTVYHEGVGRCLRIHPYDNESEGFFVAKIRKQDAAADEASS
jgi:NOL1/NOP2/sun family putative RNA methylase